MGLRQIYGSVSGGGAAGWDYVGKRLRSEYVDNAAEEKRRAAAKKRDDLYENCGDKYLEKMIESAFADQLTKDLRLAMVQWAKHNNYIRSIVDQKATVYSAPAARTVAANEPYRDFLEVLDMDGAMRELNRKLALHEDAWVQYRVRTTPRGLEPVVDIISPAKFWAVAHPRDATMLVAIVLDQRSREQLGAVTFDATAPAYRVWADDETFQLDGACRVIEGSVEPWPLGRMPGVLATLRTPATKGCLLAENPNGDLVAAHESVTFQELLLLKESKSANRQTYLSGDVSAATTGQSADTEREAVLPEGVTPTSVDRGMDLAQFRDNADHIADNCGANHGVPPSVRRHRDASSGAEIHLRRIPIREIREQHIPVLRRVERELAGIQAAVNAAQLGLTTWKFQATGWAIDFGEIQQPLTEQERDQVYETRRRLLLRDCIEEEMARNPDLKTPEAAWKVILRRVDRETTRVAATKGLQEMDGSTSSEPGEPTPEENGKQGRPARSSPADRGKLRAIAQEVLGAAQP